MKIRFQFIYGMFPIFMAAASQDGMYYSNLIRVYIKNQEGPIRIEKVREGIFTGLASFDTLLVTYHVSDLFQWLPTATNKDRDKDIFLNRFYDIYFSPNRVDIESVVEAFQADPHIRIAERVPIHRLSYTPNDPKYNLQSYLSGIHSPEAWDMWDIAGGETPGDPSIVIGIVDSGCDWDHPDLIDNLWQNMNEDSDGDGHTIEYIGDSWQLDPGDLDGVDDDGNGYIDDLIGWDIAGATAENDPDNDPVGPPGQGNFGLHMHGTHVAGISAATTNNGIGIASTGWSIKHMPVKTMEDDDPDELIVGGYQGMLYAAKAGANIINCSWGSSGYSSSEQSIINNIYNNYNVIIVAAAGNGDNAGNEQYGAYYPASYNHVISVTALGPQNQWNQWNHWATYHESVDIAAPGEDILSTVYANISGGYQSWDGTSMASPVVASSYGLLWSYFPDQPRDWIETRLIETADPIIYQINQEAYLQKRLGSGRVDIFTAIASGFLPKLSVESYSLQMVEDDDGILNPGETAKMRIVILNEVGWAEATNVTAVLTSEHPDMTILDDTATFPNIVSGGSGVNILDRFEFRISPSAIPENIPVTITITANENYQTEDSFEIEVTLNQLGFPFISSHSISSSPAIADIDNNGQNELLFGSNDTLFVLNYDGSLLWSFSTDSQIRSCPSIADIDGDGDIEIVFGSKNKTLIILNNDGSLNQTYETNGYLYATTALSDLDGDGDLEIIFGDFSKYLYVIHHDGSDFGSFPLYLGEILMTAPAVGDVNGNDSLDIVVGTLSNHIYAIDINGKTLPGFPYTAGDRINSDPALADLDQDGKLEILVGSDDNSFYGIDDNGSVLFSVGTGGDVKGSPAIVDVNGDGELEIFFGSIDKKIYGIDHLGNNLLGWPYNVRSSIRSSPVFYDLNDDGIPEIISADLGGKVYALTIDGELFPNFPILLSGTIDGSFTVDDLDGDGDPEISVGSGNTLSVIDVKSEGGGNHIWRTYRANLYRTGNWEDLKISIKDSPLSFPEKFKVTPNYPNPFNPVTTVKYTLPKKSYVLIDIFNILGEHITTLRNSTQPPGHYQIQWNASNNRGNTISGGIYFLRVKTDEGIHVQKMMYLK